MKEFEEVFKQIISIPVSLGLPMPLPMWTPCTEGASTLEPVKDVMVMVPVPPKLCPLGMVMPPFAVMTPEFKVPAVVMEVAVKAPQLRVPAVLIEVAVKAPEFKVPVVMEVGPMFPNPRVTVPLAELMVMPLLTARLVRLPDAAFTREVPVPAELSVVMPCVMLLVTVIFPEALLSVMPVPATREFRTPFEAFTKLVPVPADDNAAMP